MKRKCMGFFGEFDDGVGSVSGVGGNDDDENDEKENIYVDVRTFSVTVIEM